MKLQPQDSVQDVAYPTKKARRFLIDRRWVRRIGVAVAFTSMAAFGLACDRGMELGGVAGPEPDYYLCEDHVPEPAPDFLFPGTFSRLLCPGQSTWMEMNIDEQVTLHLELDDESHSVESTIQAVVVDPEGAVVSTLDGERTALEMSFSPGIWRITVTQRSESARGNFSLHIDEVL